MSADAVRTARFCKLLSYALDSGAGEKEAENAILMALREARRLGLCVQEIVVGLSARVAEQGFKPPPRPSQDPPRSRSRPNPPPPPPPPPSRPYEVCYGSCRPENVLGHEFDCVLMAFGKYRNRCLADIWAENPNYLKWVVENVDENSKNADLLAHIGVFVAWAVANVDPANAPVDFGAAR
jgi:hypothetical protein